MAYVANTGQTDIAEDAFATIPDEPFPENGCYCRRPELAGWNAVFGGEVRYAYQLESLCHLLAVRYPDDSYRAIRYDDFSRAPASQRALARLLVNAPRRKYEPGVSVEFDGVELVGR
jgi:hypothetical protein